MELHGRARLVMSGAGSCNVLETDTSYEEYKANHGAPMDVWRLDFSVRNGSGRWLDHLIAHFKIDIGMAGLHELERPGRGATPRPQPGGTPDGHDGRVGGHDRQDSRIRPQRRGAGSDPDRHGVLHRASRRPGSAVLELVDGFRLRWPRRRRRAQDRRPRRSKRRRRPPRSRRTCSGSRS